jgi:hypothetical protein
MYSTDIYRAFKNDLECSTNCKLIIDKYIAICFIKIKHQNTEIQNAFCSIRDKKFLEKLKNEKNELECFLSELLLTSPNITNDEAISQFIDNKNYLLFIDI